MTSLSDDAVSRLRRVVESSAQLPERYIVQDMVGKGGMGTVWRAYDTVLGRNVAVKILEMPAPAAAAADRMEREAMVVAHLEHPGIVPVHDAGVLEDGRPYYVMRLVRGVRLDEHTRRGIGRGELLRIVLRICETIAFANAQGVVHRDLKPGNVMIGPFGEVLVLDWGVAKVLAAPGSTGALTHRDAAIPVALSEPLTGDGMVVGTRGYMSPEQEAGASANVDQRADVFGIGVLMRELLAIVDAPPNRALNAIVAKATAADRTERYDSARQLADDIQRWLDSGAVTAYRENLIERLQRAYQQHQVAVLLILVYLVVRTIILLWRDI